MNIGILGSGYVGLVTAACLAELGHEVVCVDIDRERVAALRRGEVPIYEESLPELLARHSGKSLRFTDSLAEALEVSTVVFIAVGTPASETGEPDLSYVEAATRDVARLAKHPIVLVEKSTVPVCTSNWIRLVITECDQNHNIQVAANPEFLREGTAVRDFLCPDRIVIGSDSHSAEQILQDIYRPLTDGSYYQREDAMYRKAQPAKLISTRTKSAELIKLSANAYLAMKLSFINAVSIICENVGADIAEVSAGIGADERIGSRFLNPGVGFGGSCFPKDLKAFQSVAAEAGYDFRLLKEVIDINEMQRVRFIKKVRSALWNLPGKRLAVLGMAFKGGTDDVRESPALAVIRDLVKMRCQVIAYDPAAQERAKAALGDIEIEYADSAYAAAEGADAVLILTEWTEFKQLDLVRLRSLLRHPVMIDGRNLFDPEQMAAQGFYYYSIGRPSSQA
jgi:UDPglucose 6-dehydrogenase